MIVPLLKKGDVCSYHRLLLPFKYMELMRPEFETEQLESLISKASIVIFNRYYGGDIIDLLRLKKKYKFFLISDQDDFFDLYPKHVAYKGWVDWNMAQRIKESVMNSDYVITTTSRLADSLRQYNKNIEIIPNALPFDEEQFINDREVGDKVRFGIFGGKTHEHDLKQIQNCFRKLERKDSGKYEKILAGYDENDKDGVWHRMENIVKGNGEDYTRIYRLPLEMYMNAYNNADVALAPLESNFFNTGKSNLKILEAGCKEMPIITSNWPPYSDEPTDLVMKANSTNEWYFYMKYCIDNPNFIMEHGKKLGEYVRLHYNLKKINEKRIQLFEFLSSK